MQSFRSCFAPGTLSNLNNQWNTYFAFTSFFKLKPIPATHKILSLYAQLLSRTFESPHAIRNYISGVKTLHTFLDLPINAFDHPHLKFTLKGLQRTMAHLPKRAPPITIDMLYEIHSKLNLQNHYHLTLWALSLTAFFTMARKSNLVKTPQINTSDHYILRKDIHFSPENAVITFRSSKTNQYKDRIHPVPLIHIPASILCPVTALTNMTKCIPAQPNSPAFILPNGKPVTYQLFNNFTKSVINTIGKKGNAYSTHSFRRGGATHAFRSHVPPELIKHHGDWRSDAYLIYLEYDLSQKLSVSKSMSKSLEK